MSSPPTTDESRRDPFEGRVDGLYLVLISLHGLVRGDRMELGRDPDTGGQVHPWAAALQCHLFGLDPGPGCSAATPTPAARCLPGRPLCIATCLFWTLSRVLASEQSDAWAGACCGSYVLVCRDNLHAHPCLCYGLASRHPGALGALQIITLQSWDIALWVLVRCALKAW